MTKDWYMPKLAVAVVAEQIQKFIDERDHVSPIEMAHRILNALHENQYVHAEFPNAAFDPGTPSCWVMPLNSVHAACLGATGTGRACIAPIEVMS